VRKTTIGAIGGGGHQGRPIVTATLALFALGVVFGDIGTSPLYTIKECVALPHGVPPTPENILGILSLVFWSLVFVIVAKYATFILQADNEGEGGILALLALVAPRNENPRGKLKGRMALAEDALQLLLEERRQRDRLLPYPGEPGRRDRRSDRVVAQSAAARPRNPCRPAKP